MFPSPAVRELPYAVGCQQNGTVSLIERSGWSELLPKGVIRWSTSFDCPLFHLPSTTQDLVPSASQHDPDLLFRPVLAARRSTDAPHNTVGFLSALLGLLSGRRVFVSGTVIGRSLAPSSGIYPRELKLADLSLQAR